MQARPKKVEWGLSGRGAGVAESHQRFPVAEAFMSGDVPLGGNRRENA